MWFFGKKKKQRQEEERKRVEEIKRQEEVKKKQINEIKEQPKPEKEAMENIVVKETPKQKEKVIPKTSKKGIYEIFPEAGMFKYRLKADDEVLAVSFGYSNRKSATNGVETFKNCVKEGVFETITDKAGFSRYDLYDPRGARVMVIGDFHETEKMVHDEIQIIKQVYKSNKIIDLDEIPEKEVREVLVDKQEVETNPNGKYYIDKVDAKSFFIRLNASNGQLLFVSQRYASKQSAKNGLEAIKRAITNQNFTIHRDSQNRYQFKLHNDNNQVLISGETYPSKQNCISSIQSTIRFGLESTLVE